MMKKIKIQDLVLGLVNGIEVNIPTGSEAYKETYFEWSANPLVARMASNEISGGTLRAWHHLPVFKEVETHVEAEMFYFVSGIALMLFADIRNGQPDMGTVQIVRVQPGTQIVIPAGKAHFVPVAESTEPVNIIVVSPKVDAPRLSLEISVQGV